METLQQLAEIVGASRRIFVLTGAGCSTASGIPDYRDADGGWKRRPPVQYAAFMADPAVRTRYWARSLVGWRAMSSALPNPAHGALADLERAGRVGLLVTQNVDGLHQAAGSRAVVDLHGRLDRVACMTCGAIGSRASWQDRLARHNPTWSDVSAPTAPDGDADLEIEDGAEFDVPACPRCGGIVKPDVVFFGEAVSPWRRAQAAAGLDRADAVLVVGSSLMVHSGYRHVVTASRRGLPVAVVNLGRTRADSLLTVKVAGHAAEILPLLVRSVTVGVGC